MAERSGRPPVAVKLFEQAIELFRAEISPHAAARVEAKLASALWDEGQIDTAAERLARSFAVLAGDEPDADLAMLGAQLGRFRWFTGDAEGAVEPIEFALEIGESLFLPEVLSEALNTKHLIRKAQGRREEALALLRHALRLAREHDLSSAMFRAQYNLAFNIGAADRYEEAMRLDKEGLELARRRGDRAWEVAFLGHVRENLFFLGRWEELEPSEEELAETIGHGIRGRLDLLALLPRVYLNTGRGDRLAPLLELFPAEPSAEMQEMAAYALAAASLARSEGRHADALAEAEKVLSWSEDIDIGHPFSRKAFVEALEAAFALEDFAYIERRIEDFRRLEPASRLPLRAAHVARFEALLAVRKGELETAERKFKQSLGLLREIDSRFWLAVVLLEQAEWLTEAGRAEEAVPLLAEAREIFERLGAAPWLERLDVLAEPAQV